VNEPASFLVALRLADEAVIVIGSDAEAAFRARTLANAGARVKVVGSSPAPELRALARAGAVELAERAHQASDFDDVRLAVATGAAPESAAELAALCRARGILFCAVDRPQLNSFDHVAIARAGSVSVGISTNRTAPALAKRLKEELERVLGASGLAEFAARVGALRVRTPSANRREVLGRAVRGVRFVGSLKLPDDHE
jgi:siroheme synthase-like protein